MVNHDDVFVAALVGTIPVANAILGDPLRISDVLHNMFAVVAEPWYILVASVTTVLGVVNTVFIIPAVAVWGLIIWIAMTVDVPESAPVLDDEGSQFADERDRDLGDDFHEAGTSTETVTVSTPDGEEVSFEEESFEPRRIAVGDGYRWVAELDDEPVEIDPETLGFDPADRARQEYVDGEFGEDELERRLGHDMELEVEHAFSQ